MMIAANVLSRMGELGFEVDEAGAFFIRADQDRDRAVYIGAEAGAPTTLDTVCSASLATLHSGVFLANSRVEVPLREMIMMIESGALDGLWEA